MATFELSPAEHKHLYYVYLSSRCYHKKKVLKEPSPKKDPNEKLNCSLCGIKLKRKNYANHKLSKKHQKAEANASLPGV